MPRPPRPDDDRAERDEENGTRGFWSILCAGVATFLWAQVATTGPGAPHFSSDIAWATVWSLGFVYLAVRMVVALIQNHALDRIEAAEYAHERARLDWEEHKRA